MSAVRYENEEAGWEDIADEETIAFRRRPRRQYFTRGTMAVLAIVLGVAGFYAGVRVEKAQLSNSSGTSSLVSAASRAASAFASRLSGAGGGGRTGGGVLTGGFSGGNSSFGTVSSVSGNAIYITDATGNVVKVTFNGATNVTKNVGVAKSAIRPGDTVVVQGVKGSNGTISATSVSDSGTRSGGGGGGGLGALFGGGGGGSGSGAGGSAAGGSGAGGSAINQLFGGGGKG